MLLFPTKHKDEGFPGTIVDAFCAGLPVIASNWTSCCDIVTDKKTGIIYEFSNKKELKQAIIQSLMLNEQEYITMCRNDIIEAKKYLPEFAINSIIDYLEV